MSDTHQSETGAFDIGIRSRYKPNVPGKDWKDTHRSNAPSNLQTPYPMIMKRIMVDDTAIDRVDTNLIRAGSDDEKPVLCRLATQHGYYFVDNQDFRGDISGKLGQLSAGMDVRVAVRRDRGRRMVAWLRSAGLSIAPPDARAEREENTSRLFKMICVIVVGLLMLAIPIIWVDVAAIVVAIVGVLGAAFSIISLVSASKSRDAAVQDSWQSQPVQWEVNRSIP